MNIKKIILVGMSLFIGLSAAHALTVPDSTNQILNENDQQVLDSQGITDPIRDWAYKIIDSQTKEGDLISIGYDKKKDEISIKTSHIRQ